MKKKRAPLQSSRRPDANRARTRSMLGPRRVKECEFTKQGILPDYKDVKRIQKYVTQQGKIMPRRRTGVTAKMQRRLTVAIKRARHLALLPFVGPTER